MSSDSPLPETKVLAIASHVVYGYVGNTMAAFVMQVMGCEVAALNTVQFSMTLFLLRPLIDNLCERITFLYSTIRDIRSLRTKNIGNHTGYGQFKGTKSSAQDISDIYEGLKQSCLTDFDVMLSGYAPSAESVEAIGSIARDLRLKATMKPGSFFWVLDPVMGDDGQIYVNKDVIPMYKNLIRDADLIIPNLFEAELLSDTKITSISSLLAAIATLHQVHRIPHIIITSVSFSSSSPTIFIVGSTARADLSPRLFRIGVPNIDCFFSGTGDMFAALTVVRLRQAATASGLEKTRSWVSPDEVEATELPLAKAAEQVVASMHAVLQKTKTARDEALEGMQELECESEKLRVRRMKAAEVRIVRNLADVREPKVVWRAEGLGLENAPEGENGWVDE
ncbi:putative pyridoxal kinase [Pseudocyphellaria aurata]|nr:putative pyridoxal kinase [Pseudocyphellaria aurata]